MIDFHTHILPAIDDGSRDAAQSEQMLRMSCDQGVEILVLTPHFDPQRQSPQAFVQARQAAYEQMAWAQREPHLLLGAEVAYFSGISQCSELELLSIAETGLVLVELPFDVWPKSAIDEVCMIRQNTGLTPVVAHIDRYRRYAGFSDAVSRLLQAGVLLQCNASALLSFWGSKALMQMLCEGNIHFLGSDCHNTDTRPPNLGAAEQKLRKKLGQQELERFCTQARSLLKL